MLMIILSLSLFTHLHAQDLLQKSINSALYDTGNFGSPHRANDHLAQLIHTSGTLYSKIKWDDEVSIEKKHTYLNAYLLIQLKYFTFKTLWFHNLNWKTPPIDSLPSYALDSILNEKIDNIDERNMHDEKMGKIDELDMRVLVLEMQRKARQLRYQDAEQLKQLPAKIAENFPKYRQYYSSYLLWVLMKDCCEHDKEAQKNFQAKIERSILDLPASYYVLPSIKQFIE